MAFDPYVPRPIRFQELWTIGDDRLKAYAICLPGERVAPKLWLAARDAVQHVLETGKALHQAHGAGFVVVEQGERSCRVRLDRWANETDLFGSAWVTPSTGHADLQPLPESQNRVSVWGIYVEAFERHAWLAYVINNPDGPDLDAYLTARLDADV